MWRAMSVSRIRLGISFKYIARSNLVLALFTEQPKGSLVCERSRAGRTPHRCLAQVLYSSTCHCSHIESLVSASLKLLQEITRIATAREKREQWLLLQNWPHGWVGGRHRHTWLVGTGQPGTGSVSTTISSQHGAVLKVTCSYLEYTLKFFH